MAESDDLRTFIRDLMARSEKNTAAWERRMEAADALDRRRHAEVMAAFAADRERLDEIRAEGGAQREALFNLLDRLDGPATA